MQNMLELLVSRGFDGISQNVLSTGDASLIIISSCRKSQKLFIKTASRVTDQNGDTILFYAIRYSFNMNLVSSILEEGVDINHQNNVGENAAHYYFKYNYPDYTLPLMYVLKFYGFTGLDKKDKDGCTPVMILLDQAKFIGNIDIKEILEFLFEEGVDFNAQDNRGLSVLFYAIRSSQDPNIIHKILDFGAHSNHETKFLANAAHFVLANYQRDPVTTVDVLRLLRSKGFDGLSKTNDNKLTPFLAAIKTGRVFANEILLFLSKEGVDFNEQDHEGRSVLFYAIQYSRSNAFIQKILNFGANPNHITVHGRNAAHLVLEDHKNDPALTISVLKLLKLKGFNGLNKKDDSGCTPIMRASEMKESIILFLSEEGVDFNAQDNLGHSVLFYAIEHSKHLEFIQKILELGANPNHKNYLGSNAAHLAIKRYQDPIFALNLLKLLLSHNFEGLNLDDNDGCTPIMTGVLYGGVLSDKILLFFHENGVDFNAQDCEGDSLLIHAIEKSKSPDFVEKILNYGANPNHKNQKGLNAADIIRLMHWDDPTTMLSLHKLLVSKGFHGYDQCISRYVNFNLIISEIQNENDILPINPNILVRFFETASKSTDENGDTILFHVIRYFEKVDLVQITLDQGVNVNHTNNRGENAGHALMQNRQKDSNFAAKLQLLLSAGFTWINEKDNAGYTPILKTIRFGSTLTTEALQVLQKAGVNFNAQDKNGDSILFYAIENFKNLRFIKNLLDFGVDTNHKNHFESNAAHLAMKYYQDDPGFIVNLLKLLNSKGFEGMSSRDHDGYTPIKTAVELGEVVDDEVLEFFHESGVDFNAQDDPHGNSLLFSAIANSRSLHFIQKILDLGGNPNHINKAGRNAAHLIFETYYYYGRNPNLALDILKMLESLEFDGFNQRDFFGDTPLQIAMKNKIRYKPVLKFLHQKLQLEPELGVRAPPPLQ